MIATRYPVSPDLGDLFTPAAWRQLCRCRAGCSLPPFPRAQRQGSSGHGRQSEAPVQDTKGPVLYPSLGLSSIQPRPVIPFGMFRLQGRTYAPRKRGPTPPFQAHVALLHFGSWQWADVCECTLPQALPLYVKLLPAYTPASQCLPPSFPPRSPQGKGVASEHSIL